MRPHLALTAAVAALALLASALAGAHRRAALVGAGAVSLTALASLLALGRTARSRSPVKTALAVITVMFLVRLVLVSLATVFVVRAGESVPGFVVAFFVPYFAFAAIEGAYAHSMGRLPGSSA